MSNADDRSTLFRVREIFASPGFRRFFATRATSQIGDGIFQLATAQLLLFAHPERNIALTLTILSVVTLVPFSLISPFVGVFIDRWDRRRILERTPALRAVLALVVTIAFGEANAQGAAFYVIVLFILSANRLFLATMSAVLPQLVPEDDLFVANAVASTGGSITQVIGLGIGAAISQVIGGTRAAGIAGVAFAVTAVLAHRLPVGRDGRRQPKPLAGDIRAVVADMREGLSRVRRNRRVAYALGSVTVSQTLVGAMTAAIAVYFISVLHLKVGAATALLGVIALGIGVGVAIVPWLARTFSRREQLIPASFAVAGVAVLLTGLFLSRPVVIAGGIFVGFAYAMTKIPVDTIVQEEMPDALRGRAFAIYDMLFNVARVAGSAIAAVWASNVASPRGIVLAAGGAYLVASALSSRAERTLDGVKIPAGLRRPRFRSPAAREQFERGRTPAAPAEAELFPAGEMVVVRAYAGHRADSEPRAVVVGDREIAVDEVVWRAVEEGPAGRRRVFVLRLGSIRVRLSSGEDGDRWEVERVLTSKNNPTN